MVTVPTAELLEDSEPALEHQEPSEDLMALSELLLMEELLVALELLHTELSVASELLPTEELLEALELQEHLDLDHTDVLLVSTEELLEVVMEHSEEQHPTGVLEELQELSVPTVLPMAPDLEELMVDSEPLPLPEVLVDLELLPSVVPLED